jgi:3-methylcrotonyl-CoA carboxylase alpha subunit
MPPAPRMFPSVLIANRGEIACRIIRSARLLGMRTIAVHSEADRNALFVRMADEAHEIGPAPARESYLDGDRIIAAALKSRAACLHPGYGFLSENAAFAEACAQARIAFIGPPPAAIRAMGLKDQAKALVEKAGVPVVPGYHGARQEPGFLRDRASNIGFPVLIKAVAGGGGKGMRRVDRLIDFEEALASARREAASAFGNKHVLIEKYVRSPRHIEVQVFADRHGNVVHLFERDCSLQRRHQKVIEEAPAPGMTAELRDAMGKAAVEAARAVGYVGAGTVEFIVDGAAGLSPDGFYFMEMNTRLQVEHPVTEAITGLDLVALQFRVAAGEVLPFDQEDLAIRGHAVEARLYAEDPTRGFLPSTGRLWALRLPQGPGIRVDSGVREGDEVTPYYDPMIAKVIAHGATREEALDRLGGALSDTVVAGPRTNVAFLARLAAAPGFRRGDFDTGFIDENLEALGAVPREADPAAVADGAYALMAGRARAIESRAARLTDEPLSPWSIADGFQLGEARRLEVPILVDGTASAVTADWSGDGLAVGFAGAAAGGVSASGRLLVPGDGGVFVVGAGQQTHLRFPDPTHADEPHGPGDDVLRAPMHGKLVAVFVLPGEEVSRGQRVAVVEAMKMEHALTAPRDGRVADVLAKAGQQVEQGAVIVRLQDGEDG